MEISRGRTVEDGPSMDLTPMVDVVFLLIIFFVFAIPNVMMPLGIRVNLPKVVGAEHVEKTRLEVIVTAEDRIFIGGKQLSLPELRERLDRFVASGGEAVSIRGDVACTLGRVLAVYGAAKGTRVKNISVLTGVEVERGEEH
ncbi:MAG: biopolymer transporter ExbD [Planctomycetes bacterium]|nr:biopolymer transporter ExbD [Planctomycetota bacterium]